MHGKMIISAQKKLMRDDDAFTSVGVTATTAKKLLKKIDKHEKTQRHQQCLNNEKVVAEDAVHKLLDEQKKQFAERNLKKVEATEKVFRVAYLCAKENLSFTKYPEIIKCHVTNGIFMGSLLYSRIACHDIIMHIADEMRKKLIHYMVQTSSKFAILVDESTTLSTKCALIIYVRIAYDGEVTNYFFKLVELEDKSGRGIAECIISSITGCGLPMEFIKSNLVGFCSDGASSLVGLYHGAAAIMRELLGIEFIGIHCMAHRLELAVHGVVKSINSVSHFKMLCEEFHNIYALSTKRLLQLEKIAKELSEHILKIGKVFDVRWLMSSYTVVNALWKDLGSLQKHMTLLVDDQSVNAKERAKYAGLKKKIKSWVVVAEIALMRDALKELSRFSLYLQRRDSTIITVGNRLEILRRALVAMKSTCGSTLQLLFDGLQSIFNTSDEDDNNNNSCSIKTHQYLVPGTTIMLDRPTATQQETFHTFRTQVLQGMVDNVLVRFPDNLLRLVRVLDPSFWPTDEIERALFGDREVMELATLIHMNEEESISLLSDYQLFKLHYKPMNVPALVEHLKMRLSIIPISSAECERGFSAMNRQQTDDRNRLQHQTLSSLLFISANGPAFELVEMKEYVVSWLMSGRQSALDSATHVAGKPLTEHREKLFL